MSAPPPAAPVVSAAETQELIAKGVTYVDVRSVRGAARGAPQRICPSSSRHAWRRACAQLPTCTPTLPPPLFKPRRTPAEFAAGHVPGAVNVPVSIVGPSGGAPCT